jgi:hypothetical protein
MTVEDLSIPSINKGAVKKQISTRSNEDDLIYAD